MSMGEQYNTRNKPGNDHQDRLSIVSGPRLRKYEAVVWDDGDDGLSVASTMSDISFKLKEAVKVKCGTREKAVAMPSSWKHTQKLVGLTNNPGLMSSTSSSSIASSAPSSTTVDSYVQLRTPSSESWEGFPEVDLSHDNSAPTLVTAGRRANRGTPLLGAFDDPDKTPTNTPHTNQPNATKQPSRPAKPASYSTSHTPVGPQRFNDISLPPLPSPSFTLISLAEAQERERARTASGRIQTRPQPVTSASASPASQAESVHTKTPRSLHVKGRRSGFMRLVQKTPKLSPVPQLLISSPISNIDEPIRPPRSSDRLHTITADSRPPPSPTATESSSLMPRLQLRPVSINIANGLPLQYFAAVEATDYTPTPQDTLNGPVDRFLHPDVVDGTYENSSIGLTNRIKELEAEVKRLEDMLGAAVDSSSSRLPTCPRCGEPSSMDIIEHRDGLRAVTQRGRAKTGGGTRAVFGTGSNYEREAM